MLSNSLLNTDATILYVAKEKLTRGQVSPASQLKTSKPLSFWWSRHSQEVDKYDLKDNKPSIVPAENNAHDVIHWQILVF